MLIKDNLKKVKFAIITLGIFLHDYKKYLVATNGGFSEGGDNVIYKLRKDYHKIEKGLTMQPRREYFGLKVLDNIIKHISSIGDKSNPEVLKAINVINRYLEEHEYPIKLKKYIDVVNEFGLGDDSSKAAFYKQDKSSFNFSNKEKESYQNIIMKRRTTRHFRREVIDLSLFSKVFDIARFSPSACNRQSWNVKVITSEDLIEKTLAMQNGNEGFKEEIKNLVVITADLKSCVSPEERKQVWFDSGLFTMNLINTFHVNEIGSCCLNWCVGTGKERYIKNLLGLRSSEVVTVILAVGYYKNEFLVCDSPKKMVNEFVEYIE